MIHACDRSSANAEASRRHSPDCSHNHRYIAGAHSFLTHHHARATPARPSVLLLRPWRPLDSHLYLAPTGPSLRPLPAPPFRPPAPRSRRSSDTLTEALGAESLDPDDVAMPMDDAVAVDGRAPPCRRQHLHIGGFYDDDGVDVEVTTLRRTRSRRAFPPPISVIGKGGRPWLSLRAHREAGRLVLREMRLPSQELLQPCKEDGRFKLLMHPEAGGRARAAAQDHEGQHVRSCPDCMGRSPL